MKPLNELTKEELLQLVSSITDQLKINQSRLEQFQSFHNTIFTGTEEQPSLESKINQFLQLAHAESKAIENIKQKIVAFHNEALVDNESASSFKTTIENFLKKTQEDYQKIKSHKNASTEFNNFLFHEEEGKISFKNQILSILQACETDGKKVSEIRASLETYYKEALIGTPESESLKAKLDAVLTNSSTKINEIISFHKKIFIDNDGKQSINDEVQEAYDAITLAQTQLLIGDAKNPSVRSAIIELHSTAIKAEKEVESTLLKLKEFQSEIYDDKTDANGAEVQGLRKTTETLKLQLSNLIQETTEKLHAITDSSLHNSFFSRARKYSAEYATLSKYTFMTIFAICGVTAIFAVIQLINVFAYLKPFSYNLEIYQLGITLPLVYAIWMLNRNQKIAKKLAEEYHHKAALAEAMTGYRSLYQLKHDSPEYMNLFNGIKDQLNNNPSSTIDKFLNLKSPAENLIKESSKIVDPEKVVSAVAGKISGK